MLYALIGVGIFMALVLAFSYHIDTRPSKFGHHEEDWE